MTLPDEDTVPAAVEQFRRRPAVGFSNCLLIEIARKAGTNRSARSIATSADSTAPHGL